jgi:hypothetical protein
MNKPQDEFSIVPLENDDELFEVKSDDVTQLSHWKPEAIDLAVLTCDQMEAIGEALKKRGDEMKKAGQARINAVKNFKEALKGQMRQDGSDELIGNDFRLCVQKTKPKMVIENESAIPEAYRVTRTVTEVDETRLRQDLELGVPVDGARLEMSGSLRIRPNTKKGAA